MAARTLVRLARRRRVVCNAAMSKALLALPIASLGCAIAMLGCAHPLTNDGARHLLETQLATTGMDYCCWVGDLSGPCESVACVRALQKVGWAKETCVEGRPHVDVTEAGARWLRGDGSQACARVGDFRLLSVSEPPPGDPLDGDHGTIRYTYDYQPTPAGRVLRDAGVRLWSDPPFATEVSAWYSDGAWQLQLRRPEEPMSHPLAF